MVKDVNKKNSFFMKHDIEKEVYWSVSAIESFNKEHAYKICDNKFIINNSITTIEKDEKEGMICKIFLEKLHGAKYNQNPENFGIFKEIILESTGNKYLIKEDSINSLSISLSSPQVLTLGLTHFQSGLKEDFENRKHRLVIPINENEEVNIDLVEFKVLKIGGTVTVRGLIHIFFNEKNYHLFRYKNDDSGKQYLIIDCEEIMPFSEFKKNTNAIITSFGYLTGNLFNGEYYYQALKVGEESMIDFIYYEKREKSAITNMPILDPMRFQEYIKTIDKKRQDIPLRMSIECFSNLCKVVSLNETYSRCCNLIIEGNQSKQLLLRAGIYSIALETLTNIIYNESPEKINPIPEKKLVELIKNKFYGILNEYEEFISDYGKRVLESKINSFNSPTNTKKLSKPFEIYGIKLSTEDIEILSHRNKFLHGSSGQVKKLGNNIIFVKKSYRNTRHKIITEHISSRADEIF